MQMTKVILSLEQPPWSQPPAQLGGLQGSMTLIFYQMSFLLLQLLYGHDSFPNLPAVITFAFISFHIMLTECAVEDRQY